jgi:hypothetical protein
MSEDNKEKEVPKKKRGGWNTPWFVPTKIHKWAQDQSAYTPQASTKRYHGDSKK